MPLPAYRTICNHIALVQMKPGLQTMAMDWMEVKLNKTNSCERMCSLVLDEVQIAKSIQYDPGLKQFVGYISDEFNPAKPDEAACHVLCFMVKGITLKWKQIVGRYWWNENI